MGASLREFERTALFEGDHAAVLAALQQRVGRLHLAQIAHGRRAIILFEGWAGAGKKQALKLLSGALDPCHVAVHCVDEADGDSRRHWLAPYWSRLPRPGETAIFFRSWYNDAVAARVAGRLAGKGWARACDEINEFEAQQTDYGTPIIKLFFHVAQDVQAKRLEERRADPWLGAVEESGSDEMRNRDLLLPAWEDMFDRSDTRWASWTLIAGADDRTAAISALGAVAQALERALPADPPGSAPVEIQAPSELVQSG